MLQAFPDAERRTLERNLPFILRAMAEAGLTSRNQLIAIMSTIHVETLPRFAPVREIGGTTAPYSPWFGRGYVQLTWESNYRKAERDLNIPGLTANPDMALEPATAARIFMWYWKGATGNNPQRSAERGDWRGVRQAVNGGLNGFDKFSASVDRCLKLFDRGIDPSAIGAMPINQGAGLGCIDPGSGSARTIAGIHNPQSQGDALSYALGLHALDNLRSHEIRCLLNVYADPSILNLDAQKTFEVKGIATDLDGTYTCDEIIFYPLSPGGIQAELYGYKPDPNTPPPQIFLNNPDQGIAPMPRPTVTSQPTQYANPCVGNACISRMGWRASTGSNHKGIDLAGSNRRIVASADGIVKDVVRNCQVGDVNCGGGYGNRVFIQHPNGDETRYAHLSKVADSIAPGTKVEQNQDLGEMGNTGHSFGNHLHFEIRRNGEPIDPFVTIQPRPPVSGNGGPAVPFR
jgi:hypothetical protein